MVVFRVRVTREVLVYQEEEDTGDAIKSAVNGEADVSTQQLQAIVLGKEGDLR
jgi:hypothetical protein